jgi:predicted RNase H-like HicB family nuclease
MAQVFRLPVIIERDEDGVFIVECPVLQGCHSYGYTLEEALENIKDAIRLHIEARRQLGEPLPSELQVREVEVVVLVATDPPAGNCAGAGAIGISAHPSEWQPCGLSAS